MDRFAMWRRIDIAGLDAALMRRDGDGWRLEGRAVFRHELGPASVSYSVDLDAGWRTRAGRVKGFLAERRFDHRVERRDDGWRLNGAPAPGLDHLHDLDFGFTPATNLQQLLRVGLKVGEAADIPAVWFDIDVDTLIELPQRYHRRSETTYWYESPTADFEGLLELADNGFARVYPTLWQMED